MAERTKRNLLSLACGGVVVGVLLTAMSVQAAIVAGTGTIYDGHAAVYHWDQGRWKKISTDSGLGSHTVIFSLQDFNGRLYAGTDGGAVYVYGGGTDWFLTGQQGSDIAADAQILSLTVFQGTLYAGTGPAGLYAYDDVNDYWSLEPIPYYDMQGYAAMKGWVDPVTQQEDLYIGDSLHDMVLRWDPNTTETTRELSIYAQEGGSCIWDLEAYKDHLYACSYHGRIYVRLPERGDKRYPPGKLGDWWGLATPWERGYVHTWELEVYQGVLYAGSDYTLERVLPDASLWDDLRFERVHELSSVSRSMDRITDMVSSDLLYFSTSRGDVFSYAGSGDVEQLGETLAPVYTLADTSFFDNHPRVERFEQQLQARYLTGETLDFELYYDLSGSSSASVRVVELLPADFALLDSEPPPTRVDGQEIVWELGALRNQSISGTISLTLAPEEPLIRGTDLSTQSYLYDGETVFGVLKNSYLYDVAKLHVDANSTSTDPNGFSWATAYTTVSDALEKAGFYGIPEVWVAQGHYRLPEKKRDGGVVTSFVIPGGVSIVGGFHGTESQPSERLLGADAVVLEDELANDHSVATIAAPPPEMLQSPYVQPTCLDRLTIQGVGRLANVNGVHAETVSGYPLHLVDCVIRDCMVGVFMSDNSELSAERCHLIHNGVGSSLAGQNARFYAHDCHFVDNDLGVFLGHNMQANLQYCQFKTNGWGRVGQLYYGGGVTSFSSKLDLLDCHFSANLARIGAGLFVGQPDSAIRPMITIAGCSFVGNEAVHVEDKEDTRPNGRGAGVAMMEAIYDIQDCWFVDNKADDAGAGFSAVGCSGSMGRCRFVGNTAIKNDYSSGGGALFEGNQEAATIYRSLFLENSGSYGGGLVSRGNNQFSTNINNCTFIANEGTVWGGGALSVDYSDGARKVGGSATVVNSLFYQNTGSYLNGTVPEGHVIEVYEGGALVLDHCAFDGVWSHKSVIWLESRDRYPPATLEVTEPQSMIRLLTSPFVDAGIRDYHLLPDHAPCDRGVPLTEPNAYRDLDGDLGPLGLGWDIGVDEADPNLFREAYIQVDRLVYRCTATACTPIVLDFRKACVTDQAGDCIRIQKAQDPNALPCIEVSLAENSIGLDSQPDETPGEVSGTYTLALSAGALEEGIYVAYLVSGESPYTIKARSSNFFIKSYSLPSERQ